MYYSIMIYSTRESYTRRKSNALSEQ